MHLIILLTLTFLHSEQPLFTDDFEKGLDTRRWRLTDRGDFKEKKVDVVASASNRQLRLLANTLETRDDTIKYLGARTAESFSFRERGLWVEFDLDWNDQANGCYLSAGIVLCPRGSSGNPLEWPNWLKFEYVGVPPGKNARTVIAASRNGNVTYLFTEGWPEKNKEGREMGRKKVRLAIDNKNFQVWENDKELFDCEGHGLPFNDAYVYLQLSSHSNYPSREVYFDNVVVRTDEPDRP